MGVQSLVLSETVHDGSRLQSQNSASTGRRTRGSEVQGHPQLVGSLRLAWGTGGSGFCLVGRLVGWLVGRLVGWDWWGGAVCLFACLFVFAHFKPSQHILTLYI